MNNTNIKTIESFSDISWLPENSVMEVALCDIIDNDAMGKITSAFAFIFNGDKVVLLEHANKNRGFDIPGGHIEDGESELEALRREVLEEVGAKISDIELLGCQIIRKTIAEAKYPDLLSSQVFFIAKLDKYVEVELEVDSLGAYEMDKDEFLDYLTNNNSYYTPLYEAALEYIK